jgi:predicted nucleic acid-binding protein
MLLVDTNIFLEVLLSGSRKDECKRLLGLLRDGKESGAITDFVLHSIIVIMENANKIKELRTFLLSLSGYKALHIYHTSLVDYVNATDLVLDERLDVDDAIQYTAAMSLGATAIVSFDKHFDDLKVPRRAPIQILRS